MIFIMKKLSKKIIQFSFPRPLAMMLLCLAWTWCSCNGTSSDSDADADLPDIDALVDCLLRVSQMVADLPQIVELDINPLFVYAAGKGVMAVDARIVIATD